MPRQVVTQIFSTEEVATATRSSFSGAKTVVRRVPLEQAQPTANVTANTGTEASEEALRTVEDLTQGARGAATSAIIAREDAPRYNDIDRVSNPGRGHQVSRNQGAIVTANTAGDVVGSAVLGNTIPINTSNVLMNPDEGSAIWQVARTC